METADDDAAIARISAMNLKTLSVRHGVARRGQHPKHHGCVVAEFEVFDCVPPEYRLGVFAAPRRFEALVRFSNGSTYDDREPDAHGMAIKLVAVEGEKLLKESLDPRSQDFILTDHPVFFSKSLEEYVVFNEHFTRILDFTRNWRDGIFRFLPRLLGFLHGAIALRVLYPDLLHRAQQFASGTPSSPLKSSYWSTTPYVLGAKPVKYMVRPDTAIDARGVKTTDGLGAALRDELGRSAATFTFGIHPQANPLQQPIEDTTVDWHRDPGAFVPLARLTVPQQQVDGTDGADAVAECIVFSPWHALREHRPLGAVNRARRDAYQKLARARLAANASLRALANFRDSS
jgi:hypothetical protein